MYTRRSRSHEDNRYFVATFFPFNFWFDVQKRWACFTAFFASVQIQAEVSQRVQRTISIALQVPHACRKPCPIFPLPRGRSATDAVPLAVQVQVCVEIPLPFTLSLPILGRTQVRGPLDHLLPPLFFFASFVKKICLFWHECNVPELFVGSSIIRGHFGKIPSLEYATVSVFNNKWPRVIVHYFWPDSFVLFFLIFVL